MTKKPETNERFRITCETETEQVGPVLAELARRGITKVGYELVTDVLRYKRNATRKPAKKTKAAKTKARTERGSTVAKLGKWASRHPTFTTADAIKFTRSLRKHDSACWSGLRHLVDAKAIRKTGMGRYALAKRLNGSTEAVAHG
jgi:hypothetical protein